MYSSKKLPRLSLAVRLTEKAAEFLSDFANTHAEDLDRFESKWEQAAPLGWSGGVEAFVATQQIVRSIWERRMQGHEAQLISRGLGLDFPRQEYQDSSLAQLVRVDWEGSFFWLSTRDLNDLIWISLLQYSRRLAICANLDNGCPTPYFIRSKPNQRFCSDACARPAQRAFKRKWWNEHGQGWRQERAKRSRSERGRKKSTKRRN